MGSNKPGVEVPSLQVVVMVMHVVGRCRSSRGALATGSTGRRHSLRRETEVGRIESALPDGRYEVACLHAAVGGHILLASFVDVRLADLALQALTHQPKKEGTAVLAEGRQHVRVDAELVGNIDVEAILQGTVEGGGISNAPCQ